MRDRRSGRIIMISSVAVHRLAADVLERTAAAKNPTSKVLVILRLELYPLESEVVMIEPGYIRISFQQTAPRSAKPYVDVPNQPPMQSLYDGGG